MFLPNIMDETDNEIDLLSRPLLAILVVNFNILMPSLQPIEKSPSYALNIN